MVWAGVEVSFFKLGIFPALRLALCSGRDVTISDGGEGEGGNGISPWWSQLVDGIFNMRTADGEVACFGGRLPF